MDEIIESIYSYPDEWELHEFTFRRGRLHFWIANGRGGLEPYRSKNVHMSFMDKWRFWRAFKWWCKNAPSPALTGVTSE